MLRNKTGLLLAGLAAFGYYKYSKMTPEQKKNLMDKGKDLINKNFGGLDNLFGKKNAMPNNQYGSNPL
jgi:hypothetical protein